ncbi:MAG: hypothetical protein HOQ41_08390 [Ensifer adhaerens]|nr:hypothetical protein [Ensifer adhaerens]
MSKKATDKALSCGLIGNPPIVEETIWLPSATNRMIAAAVAQLVIKWLLAILTALLFERGTV